MDTEARGLETGLLGMLAAYTDACWVVGVVERVSSMTELSCCGVDGRGEEAAAAGEESEAGEARTGGVGGLYVMLNTMRGTAKRENELFGVRACERRGVKREWRRERDCALSPSNGGIAGCCFRAC